MANTGTGLPDFIDGADGYRVLPPGRHPCSLDDFADRFAHERTTDRVRRQLILDDFLTFRDQQLRCGLAIISYWIDGSFTSDKIDPGDIDITTVVDGPASAPIDDFADWLNPKDRWKTLPHPRVGRTLLVDGYAVVKVPDNHPTCADYLRTRGYWDDWWQRSRATGEVERKGFVEVRF